MKHSEELPLVLSMAIKLALHSKPMLAQEWSKLEWKDSVEPQD